MSSLHQWLAATTAVLSQYGLGGLIVTAFADASFFPVPPDVILIPLCLLQPALGWWYALLTTLSSSLGGVFGAFIGLRFGRPLLRHFASPQRVGQVEGLFNRYGGWAVALAALTPIPYKVFTIAAGVFQVSPWVVLAASLGGRGLRFFLEALTIYLWGEQATALLSTYLGPVTLGLGVVLAAAAWYFARRPRRARPAYTAVPAWRRWWQRSPLARWGEPGLYLVAGACLSFIFLILFAKLADEVAEQEFLRADTYLLALAASVRQPLFTLVMQAVTTLGSFTVLVPLAALSMLLLARRGARFQALLLALALAGGWSIDELLKWGFHRTRPNIARLIDVSGYSFPSGHAMVATAFYGMLAYLWWRRLPAAPARRLVVAATLLLLLGIGFSRVYLGAHYPTDVLGGFLAGALWLTCCIMADLPRPGA
jgi:undecaprenyl-diphosphatase